MTELEGLRIALEKIANSQYDDYGFVRDWAPSIAIAALSANYELELEEEEKPAETEDFDDEHYDRYDPEGTTIVF